MKTALRINEVLSLMFYQGIFGVTLGCISTIAPILPKFFERISNGFHQYFGGLPKTKGNKKLIWIHGVSLGESIVACTIIEQLKKLAPEFHIAFTTTHPQVLKTVLNKKLANITSFFPLDFLPFLYRAWKKWKPNIVILIETDLWPAFSFCCTMRKTPLILVNGRISEKIESFYCKWQGLGSILVRGFSKFLVQTPTDSLRLQKIGVDTNLIAVTGNIKVDLLPTSNTCELSYLKSWIGNENIIVFGSLHLSELKILTPIIRKSLQHDPKLKIIIAPRNINLSDEFITELKQANISCTRKTQLQEIPPKASVLLLDTFGELASVYSLAKAAFVGGTLDPRIGGHNPLEPLLNNVPIVIGPYFRNFTDIVNQLLEVGGIISSSNPDYIMSSLIVLATNSEKRNQYLMAAQKVIEKNKGALKKTIDIIEKYLNKYR